MLLPGFQALELKPKDAVFVFGVQQLCRAGEGDITDQNPPFDLSMNRSAPRDGALSPDDDPAALQGDVDLGLQDARERDLEEEKVPFLKEIEHKIEERFGHGVPFSFGKTSYPPRSGELASIDGRSQRKFLTPRARRDDFLLPRA
jgi:hypothetical protein